MRSVWERVNQAILGKALDAVANHKKCLYTSGIGDLRERHAGSIHRRSLRKRLFLLALTRKPE